jgi:hypothetical protein
LGYDSVLGSSAHFVRNFGGSEQRLAGHATRPGTIAADSVFFDKRSFCAELSGKLSGDQSTRTGSDNHQVILLL